MGVDEKIDEQLERFEGKLPRWLQQIMRFLRTEDVLLSASGLAFYALVSLAPLAIVVMWITSLLMGEERVHRLAETLKEAAPENLGAGAALERVSEEGTRMGVSAAIAALWPATAYGSALVRGFDRLSPGGRSLPGMRGRALAFILLPAFLLGSMGASLATTWAGGDGILRQIGGAGIALIAGLIGGGLALILVYRFFPPEHLGWKRILWTSGLVAGAVSVMSLGFGLYLTLGADFEERFAMSGVAGLVLFGVWLLLANAAMLIGYRVARDRMDGDA